MGGEGFLLHVPVMLDDLGAYSDDVTELGSGAVVCHLVLDVEAGYLGGEGYGAGMEFGIGHSDLPSSNGIFVVILRSSTTIQNESPQSTSVL